MFQKLVSSSLKSLAYKIFGKYPLFHVLYILENHHKARSMQSVITETSKPRKKYKLGFISFQTSMVGSEVQVVSEWFSFN